MDKSFTFARNNGNQSRCYRRNRKINLSLSRDQPPYSKTYYLENEDEFLATNRLSPFLVLHYTLSCHYINPVTHYPRITNDRMTALNQWNGEKYLDNFRSCNNTNQRNQSSDRLDPLDVVRIFPALNVQDLFKKKK